MADNKTNPSSDLGRFLYKALIFLVVVILVPLFPSRAPDFVNQSLFTRGWELLHLLFVGIAVCYGLFSKRNDEGIEKQTGSSSKIEDPQTYVSRFLEVPSVFDDGVANVDGSDDGARVQSWSSQYSRGEPVVVVAADESAGKVSRSVRTKPLLLPVRSLKSRVLDSEDGDENGSLRRSNSSRVSSEGGEENVVLRSPIPWRSRSGRMVIREEAEAGSLNRPKGPDENAFRPVPKSLSPSGYTHSVSPEVQTEEGLGRKSYDKSQPPPAPPLPPHKSPLMYSSSRENGAEKEFRRIVSEKVLRSKASEGTDSSRSVREEMMRGVSSHSPGANFESPPIVGKSVRTVKTSDPLAGLKAPKDAQDENKWKDVMEAPKERIGRNLQGIVVDQPSKDVTPKPLFKLSDAEEKEVPEDIVTVESDHDSESEDEDEDKVSETLSSFKKEETQLVDNNVPDFGPDVDKKADEFIAKFREQIRLQRIESIKRSTYQATRHVT